jgi:hypothetical protein
MPAYPWQQVYKAAVLERDPAKLAEFIHAAFVAIYEHLRARGDIIAEESEALSDALHALVRLTKPLRLCSCSLVCDTCRC